MCVFYVSYPTVVLNVCVYVRVCLACIFVSLSVLYCIEKGVINILYFKNKNVTKGGNIKAAGEATSI